MMLALLFMIAVGFSSNVEHLLEELVSDIMIEELVADLTQDDMTEEETAGWWAEHDKSELMIKNGFSGDVVMYAKVACEYRLLEHDYKDWDASLKVMNFVDVGTKGSTQVDESFSFNDGTKLNGQEKSGKQSFSCPGTGYVLRDSFRRNLEGKAKSKDKSMNMQEFTKYIKDFKGSGAFIEAKVDVNTKQKFTSILIKDKYQPIYQEREPLRVSRDCNKHGGGNEIFLSIMYYHNGAVCQYRMDHKIENGILFEMVGTAEHPKHEIDRRVCHGYDRDCGCYRGYCRSTCSFGKNWCYTTDGNSQSYTYQKCVNDFDCEWDDNCGGPCTVIDSYLFKAKGTQTFSTKAIKKRKKRYAKLKQCGWSRAINECAGADIEAANRHKDSLDACINGCENNPFCLFITFKQGQTCIFKNGEISVHGCPDCKHDGTCGNTGRCNPNTSHCSYTAKNWGCSNINDNFEMCALEDETCICHGITRYGKGNFWFFKKTDGLVYCNDDEFGDPAPGQAKTCGCMKEA